jgi:hypothetical protein
MFALFVTACADHREVNGQWLRSGRSRTELPPGSRLLRSYRLRDAEPPYPQSESEAKAHKSPAPTLLKRFHPERSDRLAIRTSIAEIAHSAACFCNTPPRAPLPGSPAVCAQPHSAQFARFGLASSELTGTDLPRSSFPGTERAAPQRSHANTQSSSSPYIAGATSEDA